MFPKIEQMWIARYDKGRPPFERRGEVPVIIGIVTDAVEHGLSRNEIRKHDDRFEPRGRVDLRTNVFADLRVRERPLVETPVKR